MEQRTRDLVLAAWRENRLAGIHIDLQEGFGVNEMADLKKSVNEIAQTLRAVNVPNIWVFSKDPRTKDQITTVQGFYSNIYSWQGEIPYGIKALPDDPAVAKHKDSAFHDSDAPLHTYLKEQKRNVLFVGGVNATVCVAATIKDAVESGLYDIIAMHDCMNISDEMGHEGYRRFMRDRCDSDLLSRHFHMARSKDIITTLETPAHKMTPPLQWIPEGP